MNLKKEAHFFFFRKKTEEKSLSEPQKGLSLPKKTPFGSMFHTKQRILSALLLACFLTVGKGAARSGMPTEDPPPPSSEEVLWGEFLEYATTDQEVAEGEEWQLALEELEVLRTRKIDLNAASVQDLLQLPFLDEAQVEQIHAYIHLHGPLQTLGELKMIPLLTGSTLRFLPLFVALLPTGTSRAAAQPRTKGEVACRVEVPCYCRKGYSVANGYVGDAPRERLTANGERLTGKGAWTVGLRTEKDPGERFGDAVGAYAMWSRTDSLRSASPFVVQKVVLGDYRAGYGEGLVLGLGASVCPGSLSRRGGVGVRPMRGMDEVSFLRGAAVSLSVGRGWCLTALGSLRQVDAARGEQGEVRTLLSSGLHRTVSERVRKGNVDRADGALRGEWHGGSWKVGMTALWEHYGVRLDAGTALCRRWSMRGRDFLNAGVDYGWSRYRLSLSGETAFSTDHGGVGMVHRGAWTLGRRLSVQVQQRWYGYRYTSGLGGAVCQGSSPTNESGVTVRVEAEPWRRWEWVSYIDVFHQPWARYGVPHSSDGQDGMVQLTRQLGGSASVHRVGVRYQLKRKESAAGLVPSHRVRVQWEWDSEGAWSAKGTLQLHEAGSVGFSASETVRWEDALGKRGGRLRVQGVLSWFDTEDWASRVYQYEPGVTGSVSGVSLYGRGVRWATVLRWKSGSGRWVLEGKYSLLKRWDADSMGSGLEEIRSSRKGDAVVRWAYRF